MTDMKMLARDAGVSERALRQAVRQGTIHAFCSGQAELQIPVDEQQYIRRAWPLLSALDGVLRADRDVRFALLFGSTSSGDDTEDSDVDLVVDLRNPNLERLIDLEVRLERIIGRPVEIVRLEDAASEPSFLGEVLLSGRVLVDRDNRWPQLRARAAAIVKSGREQQGERVRAALAGIDQLLAK